MRTRLQLLRPALIRAGSALHQSLWFRRAMTFGVRVIVLDRARGVFLVRHTYLPGWYLPGGGVDRGESAEAAAARELFEEGGLRCLERPTLHGLYRNGRRDHVACFVVWQVELAANRRLHAWEIADSGFFPLDDLPNGTTSATRARLAEVCGGRTIAEDW